jgi:hypothetical protein
LELAVGLSLSALRGGAEFVVVGTFEFQSAADVTLAEELLRKIDKRRRPWYV